MLKPRIETALSLLFAGLAITTALRPACTETVPEPKFERR
jgi:hypothetical protein